MTTIKRPKRHPEGRQRRDQAAAVSASPRRRLMKASAVAQSGVVDDEIEQHGRHPLRSLIARGMPPVLKVQRTALRGFPGGFVGSGAAAPTRLARASVGNVLFRTEGWAQGRARAGCARPVRHCSLNTPLLRERNKEFFLLPVLSCIIAALQHFLKGPPHV